MHEDLLLPGTPFEPCGYPTPEDIGTVLPPKTCKSVRHTALLNPLMQASGSERTNIGANHIHGKHTTAYYYKINFSLKAL